MDHRCRSQGDLQLQSSRDESRMRSSTARTRGGFSEVDIDAEKHDSSKMTFQKHPKTQHLSNMCPNVFNMISNILKNHPDLWVYWHSIEPRRKHHPTLAHLAEGPRTSPSETRQKRILHRFWGGVLTPAGHTSLIACLYVIFKS